MVRLLQFNLNCCVLKFVFQSHNGAIAGALFFLAVGVVLRFNPTMVRLLRRCDIGDDHSWLWFQSHNGAIAGRD